MFLPESLQTLCLCLQTSEATVWHSQIFYYFSAWFPLCPLAIKFSFTKFLWYLLIPAFYTKSAIFYTFSFNCKTHVYFRRKFDPYVSDSSTMKSPYWGEQPDNHKVLVESLFSFRNKKSGIWRASSPSPAVFRLLVKPRPQEASRECYIFKMVVSLWRAAFRWISWIMSWILLLQGDGTDPLR